MHPSLTRWYEQVVTHKYIWALLTALVIILSLLSALSAQFDYLLPFSQRPTYLAVFMMILAGACYLLLVHKIISNNKSITLLSILVVGMLCRLVFITSTPIHEDDYYRYFFDGSLTAHTVNPYKFAPQDALEHVIPNLTPELGVTDKLIPSHADLYFLKNEPSVQRIAYPHVRTIYPVLAQLVFVTSYHLKPFSLEVWRGLLIFFDLIGFAILCKVLQHSKKPVSWSAIYWLNPILITETVNAAHMDVILVPLLLATLLFASQKRFALGGIFLALAIGTKIWPLLLIPILFRPLFSQPKQCLLAITPCILLSMCLLFPQLIDNVDQDAGLMSFAQYWRTNSFIFGLLEDGLFALEQASVTFFGEPEKVARYLITGMLGWLILAKIKKPWHTLKQLNWLWLTCISWLFLLSPTGYPWYLIWFLPFLAITPYMPLLCLTLLLPLYDLRYPMQQANMTDVFNTVIIPLQFLPILLMMLFAWIQRSSKTGNQQP